MALTTNLVSYYKLDSNSNDSVASNNWTDTSITYSSWKISNCAVFNGTTSKIIWSWTWFPTWSSDRTVSLWANLTSTATSRIFQWGSDFNNQLFCLYNNVGNIVFTDYWTSSTTLTTPSTGVWNLYTFTFTGTTWSLYLNGNSTPVWTWTKSINTTGTNFAFWSSYIWWDYFDGKIDEVWVWSRVLSTSEISQLYNSWNGLSYPFASTTNSSFLAFM